MSSRASRGTGCLRQASARQNFLGTQQHIASCVAIGVFGVPALDALDAIVRGLCEDWDAEVIEINAEADHVPLLLGLNPKCAPCVVANNFQTSDEPALAQGISAAAQLVSATGALE